MGRIRLLLLGAALALALTACSGDDDSPRPTTIATATLEAPSPTATLSAVDRLLQPKPTATPLPAPGSQLRVTWQDVPVAELGLYTGLESNELPPLPSQPDRPLETIYWQAFVSQVGGQPQRITQTKRMLGVPDWSADGRHLGIPFFSSALMPGNPGPPPYPYGPTNALRGTSVFDAQYWDAPPADVIVHSGTSASTELAPDGRHVLVTDSKGLVVWVYDIVTGTAKRLRGIDNAFAMIYPSSWSPDSSQIVVGTRQTTYSSAGPVPATYYLVPLAGGDARLMGSTSQPGQVQWSESGTAAYIAGSDFNRGDLWVIDAAGGHARQVTQGADYVYWRLAWLNGDKVQAGPTMVDVTTGVVTAYPLPAGKDPEYAPFTSISPDGRYMAQVEPPTRLDQAEACRQVRPIRNHVYLYDSLTQKTTTIWDCDEPYASLGVTWLADGRHVLIPGANCYACEPTSFAATIKDVLTGEWTRLTQGLEEGATVVVSPDSTKVLVLGKALRVYSQAGELLQSHYAPPGFSFWYGDWAPDNTRFAYVMGPDARYGI